MLASLCLDFASAGSFKLFSCWSLSWRDLSQAALDPKPLAHARKRELHLLRYADAQTVGDCAIDCPNIKLLGNTPARLKEKAECATP